MKSGSFANLSHLRDTYSDMRKKKTQKDQYVTKAEFDEAMGIVNKSFEHVATKKQLQLVADDVAVLKDDVSGLQQTQKTILEIVKSVDINVKEIRHTVADLPERVSKLEDEVFRLKLQHNPK